MLFSYFSSRIFSGVLHKRAVSVMHGTSSEKLSFTCVCVYVVQLYENGDAVAEKRNCRKRVWFFVVVVLFCVLALLRFATKDKGLYIHTQRDRQTHTHSDTRTRT